MSITTHSYPRAALIGNPSDGYYGKTMAFVFSNFKASVTLESSDKLTIVPGASDQLQFSDLDALSDAIRQQGYYGGIRILKAGLNVFAKYVQKRNLDLSKNLFYVSYNSNIPNRLGLSGSSAILTALFKALCRWYSVEIPPAELANLVLAAEKDELNIGAGLQDRVAQAYEQPVYMDFDKNHMAEKGTGIYTPFSPTLLPPLYIAYSEQLAEGSEAVHNPLRERYLQGDKEVLEAIAVWARLTDDLMHALKNDAPVAEMGQLLNANYDLRHQLGLVSARQHELVTLARSTGASAKFTGSGGAIIGTYTNDAMLQQLKNTFAPRGIQIIIPEIVHHHA